MQPWGTRLAFGHLPVRPLTAQFTRIQIHWHGSEAAQLGLVEVPCSLLSCRLPSPPLSRSSLHAHGDAWLQSPSEEEPQVPLGGHILTSLFLSCVNFLFNITHDYKGRKAFSKTQVLSCSVHGWGVQAQLIGWDSLGETQSLSRCQLGL